MTTIEKPTVTRQAFETRYKALVSLLNEKPLVEANAHIRIAAHISAITGDKHRNLGMYHVAASIPMEVKHEEYGRIASALGLAKDAAGEPTFVKPDWSKLQGAPGQGAKAAESEIEPPPVNRLEPMPQAPIIPMPVSHNSPPPVSDSLADIIARHIESKLHLPQGQSVMDEGRLRLLIQEELTTLDLHKLITAANNNGAFPTDRVEKLIADALAKLVHRIEIVLPNGETRPVSGLLHPQVTQAAAYLQAGVPVWKWSAAGSGKTHMARQIAEMLGVTPYVVSVDPTLTVAKLLGYRNVMNGDFVEGFLYRAYKEGGLLALDEVDTGDPGVIASINALLSNTHYLFPNNETVAKHDQFYCMALANTRGTGAVAGYTARNKLDAATLDRFAIVEVKYDNGLEMALATGEGTVTAPWKAGPPASAEVIKGYVEWVQKVRAEVGHSVLISPRASINGAKLLRAGVPMVEVVESVVWKLAAADTIQRIKDKCQLPNQDL